jgi:hypothetical protein
VTPQWRETLDTDDRCHCSWITRQLLKIIHDRPGWLIQYDAWVRAGWPGFGSQQCLWHFSSIRRLDRLLQSTNLLSTGSILILFSHLRLGLPGVLFPSGFPTKTLNVFLSPLSATCYFNRILRNLNILIIFGEGCKLWSFSLCNFLQLRIISSILVHILASVPCSKTPSVYVSPLTSETKFHTHIEPQVKLWFCRECCILRIILRADTVLLSFLGQVHMPK